MSLESQGRGDLDYRRPVLGGSVTLFSILTSIVYRCRNNTDKRQLVPMIY